MTVKQRIVELPFDPSNPPVTHARANGLPPPMRLPSGPLLKAHEIAEFLNVPPRWVMDKFNSGHVTGYRLPGSNRVRFDKSEVIAALQRQGDD